MRALVLVKHAMPEIDPATAPSSWSLNDTGREQSRRLADILAPLAPAALFSSPEPKAFQTAELLASRFTGHVSVEHDLREQERSALGWLETAAFERSVLDSFARPNDRIHGMEPADHARRRFTRTVEDLIGHESSDTLIVVSHGTVISLFAAPLLGIPTADLWQRLGLPSYVVLSLPELTPVTLVERVAVDLGGAP